MMRASFRRTGAAFMTRISRRTLILLSTVAIALAACDSSSPPPAENASAVKVAGQAAWSSFVDKVIEDEFVLNPSFAVSAGRHEFDGQLPDWSAEGIAKQIASLEKSRNEAAGFTDAALTPQQRFQRDYVIAKLDTELFWLRDARQPFTNVTYYFGYGLDPNTYVNVPYAPLEERMRAFVTYAKAIPGALAQIRKNLQTPMPRTYVEYGWRGFKGFADFYRDDVPKVFADVQDHALQAELKGAIEPAAQAMMEMSKWVESQRGAATDEYVLGAERFADMIRLTEGVTTPLDKLGNGPRRSRAQSRCADAGLQGVLAQGQHREVRGQRAGRQTRGWTGRSGARATEGSASVSCGPRYRLDTRYRGDRCR